MLSEKFSPNVLQHVAHLHDGGKEEEQLGILAGVTGNLQSQQSRGVTDKVNANHQAPLDFRSALEKMFGVAGENAADRNEKKRVNRNEDAEHCVPFPRDKNVLNRQDDEERPEKRAMIAALRRRECDELAQSDKRHEREQHDGANETKKESGAKDDHDDPPRPNASIKIGDDLARLIALRRFAKNLSDNSGEKEERNNATNEPDGLSIAHEAGVRSSIACRARWTNEFFSSLGSRKIGEPK